ncbi:hypothetical protein SNOUR_02355 [Streptomyces noursei ATCC 11455]|uniref:hypothetical protein n=1 Tax=Streptomyces noursei TaxID=1971 RepID=UPI00081CD020|nr:hypothetical protein SNOUR_02355 [Streptomyces noursei ATCC 11455]
MAGLRDLLMRFRPVGTPGPAATGVPADRTAELTLELTPTLALLDGTADEAEAVRGAARGDADRIRRDAAHRAEVITARAAALSQRIRTKTADRRLELGRQEAAALREEGRCTEAAVRRRAAARIPAMADRLADEVRRQLGLPTTHAGLPDASGERDGGP